MITNPKELRKVYAKHFQHRMRTRPILNKYKDYGIRIEQKCSQILQETKNNSFPDWTIADLDIVLQSLKKSQGPDSMGLVNEIFMKNNIGKDFKVSMLQLFNKIKKQ